MIKEIKYNGFSASPSDYLSPDGDLALAMNVIPERGSLVPIPQPGRERSLGPGQEVKAIHRTSLHDNYIVATPAGELYSIARSVTSAPQTLWDFSSDGGIRSVTPIGNTLAVLDGGGIVHYFLWRDGAYTRLGTQLPELEARPYISSQIYDNTDIDNIYGIEFTEESPGTLLSNLGGSTGLLNPDETKALYDAKTTSIPLYGEVRQNVYNKVFAKLNQVDRLLKQKGFFTAPFFVRFAYRLFDGSHAMHTVPTLMVPTTWGTPLTSVKVLSTGRVDFNPLFSAAELTAEIDIPAGLADWSDIITHIDVYVTPQAINYTDSAEALVSLSQLPFARYNNETKEWSFDSAGAPQIMDNDRKWRSIIDAFTADGLNAFALLSEKTVKDGTMYLFDTQDYKSGYLAVDVSAGDGRLTLTSGLSLELLDTPPQLPLPEGGQYKVYFFYGNSAVIYNGPDTTVRAYGTNKSTSAFAQNTHHYIELRRTDGKDFADAVTDYSNFYKVSEIDIKLHPDGFSGALPLKKDVLVSLVTHETLPDTGQGRSPSIISHMFAYNNRLNTVVEEEHLPSCASLQVQNPATVVKQTPSFQYESAYVKVVENSQTAYFKLAEGLFADPDLIYLAYPRATATELILCYEGGQKRVTLTRHPFLNLAYAFNSFNTIEGEIAEGATIPADPNTTIKYGNKIKTSFVNNPFISSEENTSELSVGNIYALSTAAKALSEGQFGQFPLYAFTDEGVWALEVTGTGTYAARQPITRDVLSDPDSVTQIDSAVLFTTDRGIMLLSGSQAQCISDILAGTMFDLSQLEFAATQITEAMPTVTFVQWRTFLARARMLYDYTNQRIMVYNAGYQYAYVFSLESKQWGITACDILSTFNSYPEALVNTKGGLVMNYSKPREGGATGYYLTRPIKLDAPDGYKTVTSLIQRGQFKKGHVSTMLYGSRDLETWYPIWASADHYLRGMRGTPYKYFRIASVFSLGNDESIYGASVQYETRLGNKLR